MWNELYNQENKPAMEDISRYVNNGLWDGLCAFAEAVCSRPPAIEYSKCSMQKGWNVKYKKGGRSLCTLYPMEGFFIMLVVLGHKEQLEAEAMIENSTDYIRKLYHDTPFSCGGRWMMIEVREPAVLDDAKKIIRLRAR